MFLADTPVRADKRSLSFLADPTWSVKFFPKNILSVWIKWDLPTPALPVIKRCRGLGSWDSWNSYISLFSSPFTKYINKHSLLCIKRSNLFINASICIQTRSCYKPNFGPCIWLCRIITGFLTQWLSLLDRSSRPEMFLVKGVLKICSKFRGEYPCRSVISIKLLCYFIEITLRHGCTPVNLLHILLNTFF